MSSNQQLNEAAVWQPIWTIDKFFTKDVGDLEHIVEYHDFDLRKHESRIIKGQLEVKDYLKWLKDKFLDGSEIHGIRPKAKCITTPDDTIVKCQNILTYAGVSTLFQCLIGNGTASAGQNLTYFNNAQAAIGVGDSTTAAAASQTDLQASSNKLRVAMNATYPQQTDGVTSASNTITFQSTFGNSQANYTWNEVGVFNSATLATGRMLNRLVQALGAKSAGAWSVGLAISIS